MFHICDLCYRAQRLELEQVCRKPLLRSVGLAPTINFTVRFLRQRASLSICTNMDTEDNLIPPIISHVSC